MMKKIFIILISSVVLSACHSHRTYFPSDEKLPKVELHIIRFDSALLAMDDTATIYNDVQALYQSYPVFMPVWVEDIIGIPTYDTAYLCQQLPLYLNDTVYGFKQTNAREQELFASVEDIYTPIQEAFSRLVYIDNTIIIPDIYLFISGFNASIMFIDDDIAVGADMYLGSDYEYYNRVVYEYQKYTMRKECIPADVVSAYIFRHYPYAGSQNRLLDNMIYRGKMMYILAQVFPTLPSEEVMGYTKEQWRWCEKYERDIWNLMMDKKDLFKTDNLVLTSYLNDGPFTSEISQESPARIGTWIGWQIVASYMEHNPSVTLQDLLADNDAEHILQSSYYRP